MISLLTIAGLELAILLNFKSALSEWKRLIRQQERRSGPPRLKKFAAIRAIRVIRGSKEQNCGSKKFKKKLVSAPPLRLEGNFERQMPSFRRSKKVQKNSKKSLSEP
jgi:hypothetical protein